MLLRERCYDQDDVINAAIAAVKKEMVGKTNVCIAVGTYTIGKEHILVGM